MTEITGLAIDHTVCSGHGRCYAVAPELFEPGDDEGRGHVVAQPTVDQMDDAHRAVQNCPEQAVSIQTLTADDKENA